MQTSCVNHTNRKNLTRKISMTITDNATILIVDDNPANVKILFSYLSQIGFRCLVANSGEKAIEITQNTMIPDLILLDILMPGLDGFETCRHLKSNPTTEEIPIIFMSALTDVVDKIKAFEVGGVDYVTKPFQHAEVLARIETHLKLQRVQQQLLESNTALRNEITERQRTEQSLRESEELFKTVGDAALNAITMINVNGDIVYWNQAAEELFGFTYNEVRHKPLHTFIIPNPHWGNFQTGFTKFKNTGTGPLIGKTTEITAIGKNRPEFPIELSLSAVKRQGDWYAVGIMQDITERKRLEREFEEYSYHLERLAVDRTHHLELITTLSGKFTAILDLNTLLAEVVQQIQHSFGYPHVHIYLLNTETNQLAFAEGTDVIGQQLKAMEDHQIPIGKGIVGWVAQHHQYRLAVDVTKDPDYNPNPLLPDVSSELSLPLIKGDTLLGVLDVQGYDATIFTEESAHTLQTIADHTALTIDNARLLTERQTMISQLQAVDEAKSRFITMMSHELRTPLNVINGFAELLLEGLSGELPTSAKNDVKLIYDSGKHLLALINDIIDISQIESGELEIQPLEITVSPLLDELLAETQLLNQQGKNLDIVVILPEVIPDIYADPTRLKQILLNLVDNAIKFTTKGSVTIQLTVLETHVQFMVSDTGIGISADKQQEIFKLFTQADMSDARKYGGIGVGLSICKELVTRQGGEIGLDSSINGGSKFFFTIPLVT